MKSETVFYHCGDQLKRTLSSEIEEVESIVRSVHWTPSFHYAENGITYDHQVRYNKREICVPR